MGAEEPLGTWEAGRGIKTGDQELVYDSLNLNLGHHLLWMECLQHDRKGQQ